METAILSVMSGPVALRTTRSSARMDAALQIATYALWLLMGAPSTYLSFVAIRLSVSLVHRSATLRATLSII